MGDDVVELGAATRVEEPPAEDDKLPPGFERVSIVYANKSAYEGTMLHGLREGYGVYVDAGGTLYEGYWKNNLREGEFTVEYPNGETFKGAFLNGRRFGAGVHTWPDGSRYEGEYKNDMRHGKGMYSTSVTHFYDMQKQYVRMYDEGVIKEEYEVFTQQQMLADKPGYGYGTHVDADGVRYEGEYQNYLRHGRGTLTYPTTDQFQGEFVEDKRTGPCMFRTSQNEYFYEIYEDDVLVNRFPSDYKNWLSYKYYDEATQLS